MNEIYDTQVNLCNENVGSHKKYINFQPLFTFKIIRTWMKAIPKLRIVIEHVSTAAMVEFISHDNSGNLAGSITLHHLLLTIEDVLGKPHNYCKPVAKSMHDQKALHNAIFVHRDPRFFFGSNSAPHDITKKECANAAAGVFSAPIIMQALAQLFEKNESLDQLEAFTSQYGADFYGLPYNTEQIILTKETNELSSSFHKERPVEINVIPFLSDLILPWKLNN